jgi:hypothetical protein
MNLTRLEVSEPFPSVTPNRTQTVTLFLAVFVAADA